MSGPVRLGRLAALLTAVVVVLVVTGTSGSLSGWTAASVNNGTNNAANASLAFSHSYPSSCSLSARTSGTVSCSGTPAPSSVSTGSTLTAADSITNNGTLTAAQLLSDFRATSCAAQKLANAVTSSDPMLPRYATTFGGTDPWGGAGAIGLSGGAYAADVAATNTASLLGGTYSIGVWFKVANGYSSGGPLMSLDVSPVDSASTAGSPMIWMDTAGKIRFQVSGTLGTTSSGVSAAAYNDGSWHLAVLSVSVLITVSTPTLYVDNASGVSGVGLGALTGGNAYWHLGWADFTGVAGAPASTLTGSLAGAFTTTSTVSSATRTSLYGAASSSAYATLVQGLSGAANSWPLTDSGTTTYTGTLPVIGATSPCTMLDIGWATTSPAGTVVAAGTKLSTFADGTWHTVTAPAPAGAQTSTISLSRDATWNSYILGLRLYVPFGHRVQAAPGGTNWSATFSWAGSGAVVLG